MRSINHVRMVFKVRAQVPRSGKRKVFISHHVENLDVPLWRQRSSTSFRHFLNDDFDSENRFRFTIGEGSATVVLHDPDHRIYSVDTVFNADGRWITRRGAVDRDSRRRGWYADIEVQRDPLDPRHIIFSVYARRQAQQQEAS